MSASAPTCSAQLVAPHPQRRRTRQPQLQHRRDARHGALRRRAPPRGRQAASRSPARSTPTCPTCRARPRSSASEFDVAAGAGAPALRPVRAAQGAGVARRLRHGAARGDADQGRRHAADRHRLVRRRAGARADPAPHAQRRVPRAARQARRAAARRTPSSTPFATGLYGCTEMLVDGFLALQARRHPRRRVDRQPTAASAVAARRLLRRQPGLLPRAARDAAPRSSAEIAMTAISFTNTLDGDEAAQARAAPRRPLRQHRHGGDAAGRRVLRSARGRPRRQRRRRPARSRRHGARAGRRPLHHRRAQPRAGRTAAPSPTSSGATPTPPCRGTCATSSSPSTASPICAANPTATCIAAMLGVADSAFQPALIAGGAARRQAGGIDRTRRGARQQPRRAHRAGLGRRAARRPAARLPARHRDD